MPEMLNSRIRHAPISARVVALLLLPLLGLTLFVARDVETKRSEVEASRQLQEQAELVEALAVLSSSLQVELDRAAGLAEAANFGVDPLALAKALGFDLLSDGTLVRARSDRAWNRVAELDAAGAAWAEPDDVAHLLESRERIEALRPQMSTGEASIEKVQALRTLVVPEAFNAVNMQLERLRTGPTTLLSRAGLGGAIRTAELAVLADTSAREEFWRLFAYLFPVAGTPEQSEGLTAEGVVRTGDAAQSWDALVTAGAVYDSIERQLVASLNGRLQVEFYELKVQPEWVAYEQLRSDVSAGTLQGFDGDSNISSLAVVGKQMFENGFLRRELLAGFSSRASKEVVSEAALREDIVRAELEESVLLLMGVLGATFLGAIVMLQTIVNPIRRLEGRACDIVSGHLDPAPLKATGPRDLRSVEQALFELSAGLQRVENQASALAGGDFDSAVFNEAAPGRLGSSIQGSVNQLRALTTRLDHEATHDPLTDLPNRAAVISRLSRCLDRLPENDSAIVVLMLDLDGFKQINDVLGHSTADELLIQIAQRLLELCGDMVGRLGGDEFLMILDDRSNLDQAVHLGNRVIEAIGVPYQTSSGSVSLTASLSVVCAVGRERLDAGGVLQRAEVALAIAKEDSSGSITVFDQRLHDAEIEKAQMQRRLREALKRRELELYFQPVVRVDGTVSGVEALLRWFPDGEPPIRPDVFIAAAAQSDLIITLDDYVINEACQRLASWNDDKALADLTMSINISGRHMASHELPLTVAQSIRRAGIDPSRLIVEVTETELIPNLETAVQILGDLRALGVGLAIDDFGTGYASVAHLRRISFDRLKIDRSFVVGPEGETDRTIASLLVSLGTELDLEVVAEGVEDEEQLEWARSAGCTHIQGHYFAKAVPMAELGGELYRLARAPHPDRRAVSAT